MNCVIKIDEFIDFDDVTALDDVIKINDFTGIDNVIDIPTNITNILEA
jgi:hypothetical protein